MIFPPLPVPNPNPLGDPHGRAALALMESLIHALVDVGTLTDEQAVGIVQDAATVHAESDYSERDAERLHDSLVMLDRIVASLQTIGIRSDIG